MSWKFEIIDGIDCNWTQFVESAECSHVFFHPSLVKAWLDTYTPLRRMQPFLVRAIDGDNEALLPMVLWHRNWKNAFQNVIVPVGYSDFDYHDPIFTIKPTDETLRDFWIELFEELSKYFNYDQLTTDGITDAFAPSGLGWKQGEICPLLHLDEIRNESDLMNFFKTSLRGDIRRQIRRLEEIGPLKMREFNSWEEIPTQTFQEFIRQHSMRWPKAYKAPHFHENMLRNGLKAGTVHFSTLNVGETEIAWHLGFACRGRYYYYMPAGHQDFFKFSPTKIHLFFLVRRAVEQRYTIYDHLRGEENYKSGWSNDSQYVNIMSVESNAFASKLKHNILKMRSLLTPPR